LPADREYFLAISDSFQRLIRSNALRSDFLRGPYRAFA